MKGVLVHEETDPEGTVIGIVDVVEILEAGKVPPGQLAKAILDDRDNLLNQIYLRDCKIAELTRALGLATQMIAEMERERDAARR
ncbi:MAG: hypothetical protein LUQ59_04380 [Methanothrix sp.]|nr:hypothetical protein [Methanothrix sp.]